jgi:signal transduction histidine kinase
MDTELAQSVLESASIDSSTRVMILNPDGVILASSEPSESASVNQVLDLAGVKDAQDGLLGEYVDYSQGLHGNIVDVFAPVLQDDGNLMGIIRYSYRYMTVLEQLVDLRYLILVILAFGALFSALLGSFLALSISRPIRHITSAIYDLASGTRQEILPEGGAEELITLQRSVNYFVERLRGLERNRRQLLANLVHELGRPLGGLYVGIQVLQSGAKDEPEVLDELLDGMRHEATLLRRLLNDLSHLYDSVIGPLELELKPVTLSEWLPVSLHSGMEAARIKGLVWQLDIPDDLPAVKIDATRLGQAIGNLVSNAIKYTPRGGNVSVTAGQLEKRVWIRVADTGPGISKEEQQDIFTPFYRGSQQKRIKQGMGLGLSIARDLVEAHSGTIEVQSTLGSGSRFTIWLPLNRDKPWGAAMDEEIVLAK